MSKFGAWLYRFMQGRYGFDQLGRSLGVGAFMLWAAGLVVGVFANVFGYAAALISSILSWAGLAVLLLMIFRVLSRNIDRRRAENEAYLQRQAGKKDKGGKSSKSIFSKKEESSPDAQGYAYLACSFCGQQMRVPSGKGKIAVKCPSCGEKTIINS